MMRGARTARRDAPAMIVWARSKCPRAAATSSRQARSSPGLASAASRIGGLDPGLAQRLARQIEPPDRGILVEVAQDVGELERAAEMVGEIPPRLHIHAEDADRQAADRTRDPVAVEIELRPGRGADVAEHVHLHAVDDREEIGLLEPEVAHRLEEVAGQRGRAALIERLDVAAPFG